VSATDIVLLVLRVEGIAIAVAVLSVIGYAVFSRYATRRRNARLTLARGIIAAHLERPELPASDLAVLAKLRRSEMIRLYFEITPSMGDAERTWLRELAGELGLLALARERIRAREWWRRLSGARLLTLVGAEPGLMHRSLRDRDPRVRAQAAAYAAAYPTPDGIGGLVEMLGDGAAICRFAAKDALMRLGRRATSMVVARLAERDDPRAIALLEIAGATASHDHLPAAMAHRDDPRPAARLLVARLLRGIGGPVAAEALVTMLADADESVREAAAEALGYLNHWPASAAIARLLDDPASSVRLASAGSLGQLGPPGELLLRRARLRGSPHAAIAAGRILEDVAR
jgi:hypothetical protein